jgi:hypothetical protein
MKYSLRDLIISLTHENGSSIGNGAMIHMLVDYEADFTEAIYAFGVRYSPQAAH